MNTKPLGRCSRASKPQVMIVGGDDIERMVAARMSAMLASPNLSVIVIEDTILKDQPSISVEILKGLDI